MEDMIKLPIHMEVFGHIILDEFESFMPHQMGDVADILLFYQIIHADDLVTEADKEIAEVGTKKSRPARDQRFFHRIPIDDSFVR